MKYFKDRNKAVEQFRREYPAGARAQNADTSADSEAVSDRRLLYNSAGGELRVANTQQETLISEKIHARKRHTTPAEPPTLTQTAGLLR